MVKFMLNLYLILLYCYFDCFFVHFTVSLIVHVMFYFIVYLIMNSMINFIVSLMLKIIVNFMVKLFYG